MNFCFVGLCLTPPLFERAGRFCAAWLPVGMLEGVLATGFGKKRRRMWALCLLVVAATIFPAACGSGSVTKGPPPQSYTVTVTATSGALQHSTQITVTVN